MIERRYVSFSWVFNGFLIWGLTAFVSTTAGVGYLLACVFIWVYESVKDSQQKIEEVKIMLKDSEPDVESMLEEVNRIQGEINMAQSLHPSTFETRPCAKEGCPTLISIGDEDYCYTHALAQDGVFWHTCTEPGCVRSVEFDDEPKCFTHSPDEGSSLPGYSAMAESEKEKPE